MNVMKETSLLGITLAAMASGFTAAGEVPATKTSSSRPIEAQITTLQQQINDLKSQAEGGASPNWLNEERSEQIRALVRETIDDASGRTSLLGDGGTAGWDHHFYMASSDGNFKLNIKGVVQTRYLFNQRNNSGADNNLSGFEMRRAKLYFYGHIFNPDFTYRINGAFDRKSGAFELEDAWGAYQLNDNTKVQWGQFKAPFLREELTSSSEQVAVDRSYVNELTTGNRTRGVQFIWKKDKVKLMGSFNDGFGTNFSKTNSDGKNKNFAGNTTEFAFTARGELLVAGDNWKQFKDYQSWSDDPFGVLVGAAVHYQKAERGTIVSPVTDADVLEWTIDASAEFGGSHIEAALVGMHSDTTTAGAMNYDQLGVEVTGGVFIKPDEVELFGRWEYYDFDGALAAGYSDQINLFTVGVNWFFDGHDRKWTTDVVYAADSIPAGSSGIGLETDAIGQDGQFVIRSQFQFKF